MIGFTMYKGERWSREAPPLLGDLSRDAMMIDDGVSADAVWNESSSSSPRARRSMVESMSLRKSDPAPFILIPSVRKAERMMIMPLRANKPVSPTPSSRRNHGANLASMACSSVAIDFHAARDGYYAGPTAT